MRFFTIFCFNILIINLSHNFAQNLIQNGNFELGGPGNGFIVDGAGYTLVTPPFAGTTVNGNYAFSTNPALVNTGFIAGGDHTTGAGIMMIIDGNTTGGQQRFYKAGSTGGGVCGLTIGQLHTFSYWIKSISDNSNTVATRANIGVQFNNVSSFQIQSGSTLAPLPNAAWQQVVYQFIPNNNCVNIELFNNNVSSVGNNFAIDDVTVLGPPNSLQFTYSVVQAGCGTPSNFIAVYAKGGSLPYTYSLSGAATESNAIGTFDNLTPGTYTITVSDANGTTQNITNVVVNANTNATVVTQDTTICEGESVQLESSDPVSSNTWTSAPNDPSLQVINNTTVQVTPAVTTSYGLGPGNNLIFNGSFQLGTMGFFTQYNLIPANNNVGQGVAGVTSNPQIWFNPFASCNDQDGTNTMLVADAATTPNTVLWRQIVPVQPNTDYTFSYWATSVVNVSPGQLRVDINGTNVNTTTLTNSTCSWQNITMTWNSGASTFATLELTNINLAANGNDFAIDNLSFTSQANCDVTVTVLPSTTLNIAPTQTFCLGATIDLSIPNTTNLVWETPSGNTITTDNLIINNAQSSDAGVYTVSVPGGGACSLPAQTNVTISSGPNVSTAVQNVLCFGDTNGTATANAIGNGPFTYSWSNGASGQTINNLDPQNYAVQVTDADGCVSSASATVGEPDEIAVNVNAIGSECNANNGSATALATGGVEPYNALWSNGATGLSVNGLAPGNYQVTIFDANNCTQDASFTITLTNGPNVSLVSSQNLSCFGAADGSAEIAVVGGDAPYTYVWTPNVSTSTLAENLTAGTYTVAVTDASNCTTLFEFAINQPNEIQVQPDVSNPTCGLQNGSIALNVSGGTAPFTYSWSPVASNEMTLNNLSAGSYTAEITDANGCQAAFTQTLQTEGTIPIQVSATSIVIQPGDSASLGVFVTGGISDFDVVWFPQESLSCPTCPFTQAGPINNTTYIVTVTTPDGCIATSSILVLVQIPCNGVFLPTIFSPNQDGLNDSYCVLGSCLESIEFAIYNRWGEEVFRTNDQSRCWDGKFRGKDAPQGVYAYKFIATESNGKTVIESGNISLVR